MAELLKPFWLGIVKWGAIMGSVLLVIFKIRQSGKDAVRNETMVETLRGVRERDKIKDNIAKSDNANRKRLREKWQRD